MNEDPLQEIYYQMKQMGYNDSTINYYLRRDGKNLIHLLRETEEEIKPIQAMLLKNKIRHYLASLKG